MATKVKLLADNIVGTNQLADNVGFTGSEGVTLPSGTTAERPSSPDSGVFRFNTTTDVMEYYDGAVWQTLGNAPGVTSISPTTETDANANITITGTNFKTGATVQFIGDDGTTYNSPSVTVNSTTTITAILLVLLASIAAALCGSLAKAVATRTCRKGGRRHTK